jgi:hypothetical protein
MTRTRLLRFASFLACVLYAGSAFGATSTGGACPSAVPVTGNHCYFIAANGSDTNSGVSESTPWLHAPGMPSCTSKCAAVTPAPGNGFVFRGGDVWHFGNAGAIPYTGGTWSWNWNGSSAGCDTSDTRGAVRTSCIYVGVDINWFSGSSWVRPILTGDSPASTSAVASCAYANVGSKNQFLAVSNTAYAWFDNFEFTGMCQQTVSTPEDNYLNGWNLYILEAGAGTGKIVQNIYSNIYSHGWTHLPFSCSTATGEPIGQCFSEAFIGNGGLGSTIGPGNVCDGWDSDPGAVGCILYDPAYLVYDNAFEHMAQIVVNRYHDWHDNIWQYYYPTSDGVAHGNSFESNADAPGCDSNGNCQPSIPANVFYNNVLGHNSSGTSGDVKLWFCPNAKATEYQFNNVVYDQGQGNNWDYATDGFDCTASNAGVLVFNNTVDLPLAGNTINCIGGMTAVNNHIVTEGGTGFGGGPCKISGSTLMNHAKAVSLGYMAANTGTSTNNKNTTCANDLTPCAPTLASSPTVAVGTNMQGYCAALLASSQSMIVNAGNACQSGTTDGCSYDMSTHTMICPGRPAVLRPSTTAWDSGAYQFLGLVAPKNVTGTVVNQ